MLELHRLLLGDRIRNASFAKALQSAITPGKTTIADIGSGTGFLSFVAEKLGAKACHLYEVSDLLPLSRELAKENGITRCTFHHAHSTQVKKPVPCDVVISETLGNWPYEENIIETMNDAQRFLKPGGATGTVARERRATGVRERRGGVMIPERLRSFVAPVISPRLYDELNVWDRVGHGLTFDAAKEVCMNNMYVKEILQNDIGEAKEWDRVDFRKKNSSIREATTEWTVKSATTFYGFAVWWEATLIDDITLSTSPADPPTHWKQIYLPLVDPITLRASEIIRLHLISDSRYAVKINVAWETAVLDAKGKAYKTLKQNMKKGYI